MASSGEHVIRSDDGTRVVKSDGTFVVSDGTEGCSGVSPPDCGNCTTSSYDFDTYRISFSGVNTPNQSCPSGCSVTWRTVTGATSLSGTFDLERCSIATCTHCLFSELGAAPTDCRWVYRGAYTDIVVDEYAAGSCGTIDGSTSEIQIVLYKKATGFQLSVIIMAPCISSTNPDRPQAVFNSTETWDCEGDTFTNSIVIGDLNYCDANPVIGYGGTATVTGL